MGKAGQEIEGAGFFGAGRLVQPLIDAPGQPVENQLDHLHQDNQEHHRHPHNGGDAPLMAVPDGDVAQAAGAHGAGDGGIGQNRHQGDGAPQDQRGLRLRQVHLPDDLEGGGAHGLGGLDHTGVYLVQRGLHHPGDEGGGGHHQRRDGALDADGGAHHHPGEGHNGHHQNDEGDGPADVDDPVQHPVDAPVGPDAVGLGQDQGHPQREADQIGECGGDHHHYQGIPDTICQHITVFGPEGRNRLKHGIPPPPQRHWAAPGYS